MQKHKSNEQHNQDMEAKKEWQEIADKSAKKVKYLEQGLQELETSMKISHVLYDDRHS